MRFECQSGCRREPQLKGPAWHRGCFLSRYRLSDVLHIMVLMVPDSEELQDHLLVAVLLQEDVSCSLCTKETKCHEGGMNEKVCPEPACRGFMSRYFSGLVQLFCNSSTSLWYIFQKIFEEDSHKHPICTQFFCPGFCH